MKIVATSGGFDPLHFAHVRHIKEAKKLGDWLLVILTRDDQLIKKKSFVFMPYEERKEILEAISWVDEVVENIDEDITSVESLKKYKPNLFCKGGDRTPDNMPIEEIEVCKKIGCKIIYGVGGDKIQSSSELVKKFNLGNKKV